VSPPAVFAVELSFLIPGAFLRSRSIEFPPLLLYYCLSLCLVLTHRRFCLTLVIPRSASCCMVNRLQLPVLSSSKCLFLSPPVVFDPVLSLFLLSFRYDGPAFFVVLPLNVRLPFFLWCGPHPSPSRDRLSGRILPLFFDLPIILTFCSICGLFFPFFSTPLFFSERVILTHHVLAFPAPRVFPALYFFR